MPDSLTVDRLVRALLRMILRTLRNPRITRIIRMFRDMPLVMLAHTMDPDMVLDMAIFVGIVRDIGVGLEVYLFPVEYRSSSAEVRFLSRCGSSKWSTTFPSPEFQNGSS